jgi:hypothetical protein
MIYRLTEKGKAVKWKKWTRDGGCGISGFASGEVANAMNAKGEKFDMSNLTLGEIAGYSYLAEKELAHFAATTWPPLELAEAGSRFDS